MDHGEAEQTQVVEKYLLGELSAAQEDEFAEHFFSCEECAQDLRSTAQFLDTTKKVLAADRLAGPQSSKRRNIRWIPAPYAVAASVALLAFTLYQNVVTIPRLRTSAAPQALAVFSLAGLGSRSAGATVVSPTPGKPFALLLDIPPQDNISEYRCQILSSSGAPVVSIDLSEDAVKKTVPLFIPASVLKPGEYQLAISGRPTDGKSFTALERYPLQVNSQR
jgi:hypothetical protein